MSASQEQLKCRLWDDESKTKGRWKKRCEACHVDIENFGIATRTDGQHFSILPGTDEQRGEKTVPLHDLWGTQPLVCEFLVAELASLPTDFFVGEEVIRVLSWPDGTHQVLTHHRAAAAGHRGDDAVFVRPIGITRPSH